MPVGTPIAVVTDDDEDAQAVMEGLAAGGVDAGVWDRCTDAYWQAYTKGKDLDM